MSYTDLEKIAIDNIRKTACVMSRKNMMEANALHPYFNITGSKKYEDDFEGKDAALNDLDTKFVCVKNTEDNKISTGKNLLYFSVFFDDQYVDLLDLALNSIYARTNNIRFDVLIITEPCIHEKIKNLGVLSKFNVDYMLLEGTDSVSSALTKKLRIYEYSRINDYENIMYLDTDIFCVRDLNILFDFANEYEKLYVSSPPKKMAPDLFSPFYGLAHISKNNAHFLCNNSDILPFNSGHFLFKNSSRMKMHFENVIWLMNSWPSRYCYDQSAMNHYFVFYDLSKQLLDENNNRLISICHNRSRANMDEIIVAKIFRNSPFVKNPVIVSGATRSSYSIEKIKEDRTNEVISYLEDTSLFHTNTSVIIHFYALLPFAKNKKTLIENYIKANNLNTT